MLQILTQIPEGLLSRSASELHEVLTGPTLIHLPGERPELLHVSVLLHGNETTGWLAVREILQDFGDTPLPRALSLFIGNVAAAASAQRVLDGQQDYNRVWDGAGDSPEHQMTREVVAEVSARAPIASIDIHNTSGPNPHYACISTMERAHLDLARRFSSMMIYLQAPNGLHSMAFSQFCPAITVECGLPGSAEGIAHVRDYLLQCLREGMPKASATSSEELEIYRTKARVRIPHGMRFSFQDAEAECRVYPELVEQNFQRLAEGTKFGVWGQPRTPRLDVEGEDGQDLYDVYFENRGQEMLVRRPFFLSMLTLREDIVAQDCLCYLLEPMESGGAPA